MTLEDAERYTILRAEVGSRVLGVALEGTDDRDEMGICIEPPEYVIGNRKQAIVDELTGKINRWETFEQIVHRTQPVGVRSGPGDLDLTIYSLRKWMRLALQGNPTVLMLLFSPGPSIDTKSYLPVGHKLRNNAHRFVSQMAGDSFLGYMTSQRAQLTGERPRKHTNRPELIEQYGFDTKFAYHAVRLGIQGAEFLTTGKITLPIPEPDRSRLIDLRLGKIELVDALEWMGNVERRLTLAREGVALTSPSYAWADQFLIDAYREFWQWKGML